MKAEEYARMHAAEESQWWYAGMRSLSLGLLDRALAGRRAPLRLLDAGCGTGGILVHLARRGRAWGVDLSDEALARCRARGVSALQSGVGALPFADASFDAVTCFDVLYHQWVRDDDAAVRELVRVLRPGGVLLVRVPALRLLWGAHDEAVLSRHRYTRDELVALLRRAGLRIERATYANFFLFPLVAVRRALDRATGRHGSDVGFLPAPLEWSFRGLVEIEARLVRHVALPIGTSVVALGRKPAA